MSAILTELPENETVWDAKYVEDATAAPRRLRLCKYCQSTMANPTNLKHLHSGSLLACLGTQEELACSFKEIALAGIDQYNQDRIASPGSNGISETIDIDQQQGRVRIASNGNSWYDISTLQLSYVTYSLHQTCYKPLLELGVCALPGNPACKFVSARPRELNMMSEETFNQINHYMDDCQRKHTACLPFQRTPLPTRVVDVRPLDGSDIIRVYTTCGERERYAALSYCWGGSQLITLTTGTILQMRRMIDPDRLPQTLQDAILITRKLGLKYLWIDTICIIQDSVEDKVKELKSMAQTYRNAFLTISAASARSSQHGFLQTRRPRKSKYPTFVLPYRAWDDVSTEGTVVVQENLYHDANEEPINHRAWTLQERLLSPRVLIYGTRELIWQCQVGQLIANVRGRSYDAGAERLSEKFFDPSKSVSQKELWYQWSDTVTDYTGRELSYEEDKLTAISAIASEFQRISGDTYLAGLWRRNLVKELMWMVHTCECQEQHVENRPSIYIAPSWSWASANGRVAFGGFTNDHTAFVEILHCETSLENDELQTRRVVAGHLELRAQLKETKLSGMTLLDNLDGQSTPIGKAWMDSNEDIPEIVCCIRVDCQNGLILVAQPQSSTFKRVGIFETSPKGDKKCALVCDEWFRGCVPRTILIK